MMRMNSVWACSLALAALCLSVPAWASDQPLARKSSQFPVTVAVIHSTASPQAPVTQVACREDDGQTSCKPKDQTASTGTQCATTNTDTWCWY